MVNDMRLIKADALIAQFHRDAMRLGGLEEPWDLSAIETEIESAPIVDAVPVVRCKDCKHWKKGQFMGGNSIDDLEYGGSCPLARFARYESDFCSYGEKREEVDGNG